MGWGALSIAVQQVPGTTLLSEAEAVGAIATSSHDAAVTDSAASATALATGRRTRNAWVALDPESRRPLRTIAEEAHGRGLAVGLVTTTTIVHATPAAFAAHVDDRYKYEEIAAHVAEAGFDLLVGGGRERFLPRAGGGRRGDGRDLLAGMRSAGSVIASTLEQARAAPRGSRLALLYDAGDPPPAGPGRPPLEALVALALERLAADPDGFFLMIEGGQIDWAEHDRDAARLFSELADFDRAVARARSYAASAPDTAVVVVADHDTGGPAPVQPGERPDVPVEIRFLIGDHTGLLVPLLVNGPPARAWVKSEHHTDLGRAMRDWLLGD